MGVMRGMLSELEQLQQTDIKRRVDLKLREFKEMNNQGNKEWFTELCFCLLTANTSAEMGLKMQQALGYEGFTSNKNEQALARRLNKERCRFYNRRAHFIFLANQFKDIKDILLQQEDKRGWLAEHIKGMSYKEASHFLRNIGFFEHAILDKHVVHLMQEHGLVKNIPKTMTPKHYLREGCAGSRHASGRA